MHTPAVIIVRSIFFWKEHEPKIIMYYSSSYCIVLVLVDNVLVTALESNSEVPTMDVVIERLLHEEKKLQDWLSSVISSDSALTTKVTWEKRVQDAITVNDLDIFKEIVVSDLRTRGSSDSDSDIGLVVSHALSIGESAVKESMRRS